MIIILIYIGRFMIQFLQKNWNDLTYTYLRSCEIWITSTRNPKSNNITNADVKFQMFLKIPSA